MGMACPEKPNVIRKEATERLCAIGAQIRQNIIRHIKDIELGTKRYLKKKKKITEYFLSHSGSNITNDLEGFKVEAGPTKR